MYYPEKYQVIVIGAGHAGTEAALAAARLGCKTLLLTQNLDTIGQMSCNPAIGGIGKGHIVKEIDALGGIMARAIDRAGIQFRILNARKGPAVRATRAQADRILYKGEIRKAVEAEPNLNLFQQSVEDLIFENGRVIAVKTQMGMVFSCETVVLTTGTFLGGKIHIGESQFSGGRAGDPAALCLAQKLRAQNLRVNRLKTGTPPRLDGRSINYEGLVEQRGDDPVPVFSFSGKAEQHPRQVNCHITHTSEQSHDIIRAALHRSPLFSGVIEGVGPRYCPSIEDKVVRFADKTSHQIFIEPEGLDTHEVYPNGISTSLPFDVQIDFVRSIPGFEAVQILRPGYAIEYDFFDPRDLHYSLETKAIAGLFFAGQINGTTGYEEAAGQGLIAGLNAARMVQGLEAWYPRRDQAYLGVLIDDLVNQGTREPYRMFTSRAEYRLLLREDNADLRLTEIGHGLGLVAEEQWLGFNDKRDAIEKEKQRLQGLWVRPGDLPLEEEKRLFGAALQKEQRAYDLLRRPEVNYSALTAIPAVAPAVNDAKVAEQIEIEARYAGYLQRQEAEIARFRRNENTLLPENFDFSRVKGLSLEVQQKLEEIQPQSIGQAARIAGVTPAAISLLLVYLKKFNELNAA